MRDTSIAGSRTGLCVVAVLTAAFLIAHGAPGLAQEQQQQQTQTQQTQDQQAQFQAEVTVTGTLIPRPTLEALSPVSTLDIEALTYQGNTRLEDLLTSLPQVFSAQNSTVSNGSNGEATVDLRNMGYNRTLVLIDGIRPPNDGVGADLNFIPAPLVKRVDILTGGASSTYGADAVAGVVNFILDRDFEGMKAGISGGGYEHNNRNEAVRAMDARRGFTAPTGQAWDGGQVDAYVAWGGKFTDGKGHAALYLDYRKQAALKKNRRDYTNCSVGSLGATGPTCGGSSTNPWGRFFTDDGGDYTLDESTGNTFTDFTAAHLYNYAVLNYMQRPDTRFAGGAFIDYEWSKMFHAYGQVMLMDDRTDAQIAPSGDFGNTLYINCDNPMLSADQYQKICTNAGYGPGIVGPDGVVGDAGFQVLRRNVEGGPRVNLLSHQEYMLVAGLKGELGSGWNYDVNAFHNETHIPTTYINDLNTQRLQQALFVTGDPNDPSTWQCRDASAQSQGCVPWNILRTGGVTQAALNYLSLPLLNNTDVVSESASGKVTADLRNYGVAFPSAAEGVQLALGFSYRKERFDFEPDLAYQQGWAAGSGATVPPVRGSYSVREVYGETEIPIIQGKAGAQDLRLDLGYRYSDYSTSGNAPTWKTLASWSPVADLKLRGGFNRATRAANATELFAPQGLALGGSIDPCSGTTPQFTLEQCQRTGVTAAQYGHIQPNTAAQYNTLAGGNTNLAPEVADTITAGVVITPSALPGFTATFDYYDIKIKDTITAYSADDVLTQCGLTGNPALCGLIHRDQFGSLWRTPQGYTTVTLDNIGKHRSEGVDVTLGYTLPAGDTFFSFNLTGSYLMKAEVNPGFYSYDCTGLYGNICNNPYTFFVSPQPTWRHLFRASWETGSSVISLGWRMFGSLKAEQASSQAALSNPGIIEQLKANHAYEIPMYNWFDLAFSYKLTKSIQWTFGVNNVFDKEPPLGSGSSANDYAAGFYGAYDSYGRFIHSSINFTF